MKREAGFTLVELLVVVMVIGILASMGIAGLLRSRAVANEASAIGSVRTIGSGQMAYSASCGRGFFGTSLTTLGTPPPGSIDAFVSPDLVGGPVVQKSGYQLQMSAGAGSQPGAADCNAAATATTFYLRAEPIDFGRTGTRAFATSAVSSTIWVVNAATAPTEPFASPALPLQ